MYTIRDNDERLGMLGPVGYIDGANRYQFVGDAPAFAVDPSGQLTWRFADATFMIQDVLATSEHEYSSWWDDMMGLSNPKLTQAFTQPRLELKATYQKGLFCQQWQISSLDFTSWSEVHMWPDSEYRKRGIDPDRARRAENDHVLDHTMWARYEGEPLARKLEAPLKKQKFNSRDEAKQAVIHDLFNPVWNSFLDANVRSAKFWDQGGYHDPNGNKYRK